MMYSQKVVEHFCNPQSHCRIEDADGIGKVANVKCSDVMYIYLP